MKLDVNCGHPIPPKTATYFKKLGGFWLKTSFSVLLKKYFKICNALRI